MHDRIIPLQLTYFQIFFVPAAKQREIDHLISEAWGLKLACPLSCTRSWNAHTLN